MVEDGAKLLGIVLEVDVIDIYYEYLALVFLVDELLVKCVETLQVVQREVPKSGGISSALVD